MDLTLTASNEPRKLLAMDETVPSETPTGTPLNSRLIVEFYEPPPGAIDLIPVITCDPPGRMTYGLIDRLMSSIFNTIRVAQLAKSRRDEVAQKELVNV